MLLLRDDPKRSQTDSLTLLSFASLPLELSAGAACLRLRHQVDIRDEGLAPVSQVLEDRILVLVWSLVHIAIDGVDTCVLIVLADRCEGDLRLAAQSLVEVVILDESAQTVVRVGLVTTELVHLFVQILDRIRVFHLAVLGALRGLVCLGVSFNQNLDLMLHLQQVLIKFRDSTAELRDPVLEAFTTLSSEEACKSWSIVATATVELFRTTEAQLTQLLLKQVVVRSDRLDGILEAPGIFLSRGVSQDLKHPS